MIDFTYNAYKTMLKQFSASGYKFFTYKEYLNGIENIEKYLILRHDVDQLTNLAYKMALIEYDFDIKGTYYFRAKKNRFDENIIRQIDELGHEVGYHYENLSAKSGNFQLAYQDFEKNLNGLRKVVTVNTICMHGAPYSKWDNRKLWEHKNYKNYDILGEPYFDTDFQKVFYITDTGRMWDGEKFSIRDFSIVNDFANFHSTEDIINALKNAQFPNQIMMTVHPQRWTNNPIRWISEYLLQKTKNIVKAIVKNIGLFGLDE